jgi:tRNA A-37 threonylcarbamoyl transferase component Bud32/tetratricopeptide (TPR) repeat protein
MTGDFDPSTTAVWRQRIVELFNAAAELPPDERAGFLTEACGSDCGLRAEIESLLACDAAGAVLEQPALRSVDVASLCETALDGPLPERIGAFEILELVGVGGMGVVYRARQKSPSRVVALKLIRPDIASRESRRRFATEMETLALLRHPGIATIYEAGTVVTANGARPYIAMEYVEGQPLLKFAAQHGVDRRARIELLVRVCDAIGHAHQRGVIHRDIKPANILVEQVDGTPQPRVIDFGVARMVGRDRCATAVTVQGQVLGTLNYMSPEQIDGDPRGVDTRSDVYSLGVVVYQLLSGKLPIEIPESSFYAAARVVYEKAPLPLTTRDRSLGGDLNTIVLKALAKDPDERYESAAALAADLRRYLAGEPIVGQPPSTLYLLKRYIARHRVIVAAVSIALVGLIAGLVGTGYGLLRARQSAAALEAQARQTINAATFLVERVAKDLDPVAGTAAVRRTLLERLDAQVDELLRRKPHDEQLLAARAAVWARQAELLVTEKQFDQALNLRQRVLALRQQLVASQPRSAQRRAEVSLTLVQIGDIQNALAKPDQARQLWEEALAMDEELARENPGVRRHLDDVAWGHDRLAALALGEGRLDDAERHCRQRLEINERLLAIEPDNLITYYGIWEIQQLLCSVANRKASQSSLPEDIQKEQEAAKAAAHASLEAARYIVAREPHNRRYLTAEASSLGQVAHEIRDDDPDEATRLYAAGLRINEELAELDPEDRVAQLELKRALWSCGEFATVRGEYRRAVYFLERLLEIRKTGRWSDGDPQFGSPGPVEDLLREARAKLDDVSSASGPAAESPAP